MARTHAAQTPRVCRTCGQPITPGEDRTYQPHADWVTHLAPIECAIATRRAQTAADKARTMGEG